MSFSHNAIESTGKTTVLIKDNKVVGEVRIVTICGSICGVQMIDEACKELVKDTKQIGIWSKTANETVKFDPYRFAYFHFLMTDGIYIGDFIAHNEYRELEDALKGTRIVDKFLFDYGFAPSEFANVEGYASIRNGNKKAN